MTKQRDNSTEGLDARTLTIITALVDEYVRSGNPVASSQLAAKPHIKLSSASVRNILVELEKRGLIEQVHTSSGRKPTAKGLHIYLNSLIRIKKPSSQTVEKLSVSLRTESTDSLAYSAMETVADLTQLVTLVSIPTASESPINNIQFMRLSSSRVMGILVTSNGEVRNRLIEVEKDLSNQDLEQVSQFFNEHFKGKKLAYVRNKLGKTITQLQLNIADLLKQMLDRIAGEDTDIQHKIVTSGSEQLANSPLITDAQRLSDMTKLLHRKETLQNLLHKSMNADDVSIFIGVESGIPELANSSVVMAPYHDDNSNIVGVLGLVGPMNMKYSKVMPLIDVTTSLMQEALVKIKQGYS